MTRRTLGYLRERSKGLWIGKVYLGRDGAGSPRYKWFTHRGSKATAEKRLADLQHAASSGGLAMPSRTTLGEYLDTWLRDCLVNIAPNTRQTYYFMVERHIKPSIGHIQLTKLKPEHLQKLYTEKLSKGRRDRKGGLGGRSVKYIHVTLHKALKNAVKTGLLVRNVAEAVDAPAIKQREMQTLSESDIHLLLDFARQTQYYALFFTALFTGARRSELLALKWSDVDLLLCQLSVNRTFHQLHNGETYYSKPKTERGRRLIALSPATALVLREHRAQQESIRQSIGMTLTDDDLVFSQYDGSPLLPDSITHAWHRLVNRIGLQGIRLHDCRHSHASLLLKQNVHPKVVQERLGHASINMTLDLYSHVAPGLQEAAAKRFDEAMQIKDDTPVKAP